MNINKIIGRSFVFGFLIAIISCKDNKGFVLPKPDTSITATDQTFSQSFDNMEDATKQGWIFTNLSDEPDGSWSVQAKMGSGVAAQSGSGFLYDNYLASDDASGIISDWVISPKILFQNGDKITFYTISSGSDDGYGDRLQLRLNVLGSSAEIDSSSTAVGGFTVPLVDVNPLYKISPPGDYPTTWTKYEATISGLNQPDSGRFAFRYYVQVNGGANGDEVGLDNVTFTSANHK